MSERRNQAESSIESVNELGGIRIKCRKLTMESGKNFGLESAKGTELTSEEEMGIKTKKDATHMQLPGTIKFQQSPKKEGEVTGGTSAKVKINGKEAAVIGSTVTTCNDVGARDNSTVMAAGASMPMPAIINPLNAEEWKREREEAEKKKPQFSSVKWTKTSAEEGEEVGLTATVRDIADGNAVTLQVFPEGKGPEDGAAYAKFPVTVKDGAVSARWSYRADRREMPPEQDPRFVFTAHSAWCNFAKSSNVLEVRLRRPEITRAGWRDKDGKSTSKGLVGDPLRLHAETKDFEEGQGMTFTVRNAATGETAAVIGAEVRDGIAEAEWRPTDTRKPDDTRELKYTFEVSGNRCKKIKSGECQVRNPRVVSMEWDKKAAMWGDEVELKISTFEMADDLPECKVDIWEEGREHPDKLLQSATVKLDKDEIKVKFTVDFTLKDVSQFDKDDDYRIYAVLFVDCLGKYFKQSEENYLLVSNDF